MTAIFLGLCSLSYDLEKPL